MQREVGLARGRLDFGPSFPVLDEYLPMLGRALSEAIDPNVWTGGALQEKAGVFGSRTNVSGLWVERMCSWPSWI